MKHLFKPKNNSQTLASLANYFLSHSFIDFTCQGIEAKIYTHQLAALLADGEYLLSKIYVDAFKRGQERYKTDFHLSSDILYGANAERYIKDLHYHYWHAKHDGMPGDGWVMVKKSYPILITERVIEDYGYYAGMLSQVEETAEKHPNLFEDFEMCDHQDPATKQPAPAENPAPNYLLPLATLQKVHSAFDGELWESINLNTFYAVFDRNDNKKYDFRIKEKVDFYALLWCMFDLSDKTVSQVKFIRPFLTRYNGSFNSFENIRKNRIDCPKTTSKKLIKRINEALS